MCDKPGVFHLSQFHSTNTGTVISYTSAISQYWQSSWHLLEEATYLKTCQLLSWNVEQNGRKWREFSGSTGWVGHSRSCPKAMFISLVDGIPVLKHCIHASIFPAVWVMRFSKWLCKWIWSCAMQPSAQVKKDWRFGELTFCHKRSCGIQIEYLKRVFQTSINSLTVLHCSWPSINVRRILAGGRACHSAFGATSRCDFLQCRYQCMWERTSLAKRQAFQRVSDLFLRSLLSCRLASNWNHKLQSTSICMSSHAQNLTFSNVHSCQCQKCSCSELLHASSWFPFAAQWSAGVCWMGLTFEAFSPIWSASTRHWALARLDSKGFKERKNYVLWQWQCLIWQAQRNPFWTDFRPRNIFCCKEKGGMWQTALQRLEFHRDQHVDVLSFNATISACEKAREWHRAMDQIHQLEKLGSETNQVRLKCFKIFK